MPSSREKKRIVAQGLRELQARPGWDPHQFRAQSPTERLRERIEGDRLSSALQDADHCEHCAKLRGAGDPTALCPEHLRAAMGL